MNEVLLAATGVFYIAGAASYRASALDENLWAHTVYAPGIWAIDTVTGGAR